jgi:hypothetical protein
VEEQNLWNLFDNSEIYEFITGEPDCLPEFQFDWIELCQLAVHLPPGLNFAHHQHLQPPQDQNKQQGQQAQPVHPSAPIIQPAQPSAHSVQPPQPPAQPFQLCNLQSNLPTYYHQFCHLQNQLLDPVVYNNQSTNMI